MSGATAAPPRLAALVAHARTVPSEVREQLAADAGPLAGDRRVLVVHTCHRVEVYASHNEGEHGPSLPALPTGALYLEDQEAARHLFRVAAGLDSVVVGEDQILHQLRTCLSLRHMAGTGGDAHCETDAGDSGVAGQMRLDPVLERLFQVALHVGREARSWREGPPRSLADVALDVIEERIGSLEGRTLLVVGAGRMGRLAALGAGRRRARVLVMNRSPERARALAHDAGGAAVAYRSRADLVPFDAAILAIGGTWNPGAGAIEELIGRPAPIVDLSSPPALEGGIRQQLAARYMGVDDLAHGPVDAERDRLRRRFERLLDDAELDFVAWLRAREAVPAMQALAEQAEARRVAELDRLVRRAGLDEHERALVEQMSHRLVAGILHAPLTRLRNDASGELEHAARALFSL
jgi:glutamyl-tRNA reductase